MQGLDLDRVTDRGKLAGVCAGVADRWHIDPLLVRVGAVVLGLFGGVGAVLYGAAWALLPARGGQEAPLMRALPSARKVPTGAWIAIVVVLSLISLGILGPVMPVSTGPVIAVAALWYFGMYRPGQKRKAQAANAQAANGQVANGQGPDDRTASDPTRIAPTAEGQPTATSGPYGRTSTPDAPWGPAPADSAAEFPPYVPPTTSPAPSWTGFSSPPGQQHPAHPSYAAHPPAAPPAAPPSMSSPTVPPPMSNGAKAAAATSQAGAVATRPARPAALRVRTIALIAAGVTVVAMALLAGTGLIVIPMAGYAAAALLIVGLALVVSAWTGRARGLLPVGCGLAALTLIGLGSLSAPGPDLASTGGDEEAVAVRYASMDELPAEDTYDVGRVTIDLGDLPIDREGSYEVSLDSGRLELVVPPDTNLNIIASADLGSVQLLENPSRSGLDLTQELELRPDPGGPVFTIRARVDLGALVVRYA